jgi:hypothetical protein
MQQVAVDGMVVMIVLLPRSATAGINTVAAT